MTGVAALVSGDRVGDRVASTDGRRGLDGGRDRVGHGAGATALSGSCARAGAARASTTASETTSERNIHFPD